jgi:hypothetical protein
LQSHQLPLDFPFFQHGHHPQAPQRLDKLEPVCPFHSFRTASHGTALNFPLRLAAPLDAMGLSPMKDTSSFLGF